MPNPGMTDNEMKRRLAIWDDAGRNISAAARMIGVHRTSLQETIRNAVHRGFITEADLNDPETPTAAAYQSARLRKIAAFQAKKRKGDWRKPVLTSLPARPFRLKVFGLL